MKRYILLFWLPALFCMGCDSNHIDEYELGAKLNFYNSRTVDNVPEKLCLFSDMDYLNGVTERLDSVRVDIMGVAEKEERPFYCRVEFNEDEPHVRVTLEDQYVMPAEQYSTYIKFRVGIPSEFDVRHITEIKFDHTQQVTGFTPGLVETQTCRINALFQIRQNVWHREVWGEYSNGKYKFMMDEFKNVYGNIKRTYTNRVFIKNRYEEYRKNNPPIMDDQYPPQEIQF